MTQSFPSTNLQDGAKIASFLLFYHLIDMWQFAQKMASSSSEKWRLDGVSKLKDSESSLSSGP